MAPNGRTTSVKFYGDPRAEARRDAAGIARKCQTQKPTEAPSEGDRVLLRTKPREKMDEVLALKARYTMHKWKKDGSSYFPLTNGEHQDGKKDGADKKGTGKSLAEEGGKPSCNLKSLLDNYPEAAQKEAFAPPSRVALENKEDGTKVLDKADLVDAVSNILMQMPPENILESSAAISMLARKLVDGQDSAIDSSFSQKFLLMSQIQVEVQRRLKEARSYIEELDSMEKVSNPKAPVRRRASSIANLLKALHGEKVGPPPSKTEQVANQMRTIRRLLQSLHWPNLHHEFLRWVRNSSGYETTVREFIRNVEDIFDHRPDIDHSRDDVCESITKHELRLTKSLRRYQLQMRNTGEDLARGEMKERKDAKEKERQRKLDLALERKASAKRAEIRRISLRRQFTTASSTLRSSPRSSPRHSQIGSRRPSMRAPSNLSSSAVSVVSTESDETRERKAQSVHDTPAGEEFDIESYDDDRFGHLKRIYKNHLVKIEALNDTLASDEIRLNRVIEDLKDQVRPLTELQALYEAKTKKTLRRGSLFIPKRRALVKDEADDSAAALAQRITALQLERAQLIEKIRELGKALLQEKKKPHRGAIVNQIWSIVQEPSADAERYAQLMTGAPEEAEAEAPLMEEMENTLSESEEELPVEPENEIETEKEKGRRALQDRIAELESELEELKKQITALASQVNHTAVPMNLGKAVAFEMQPKMRLSIHYTPLRPEADFLVKKAQEFLELPKMQTCQSKRQLENTLEVAKDTFDSEAAERQKCLQESKPFDHVTWEKEMNQCLPLLRDQLLSCLAELMKELERRRSIDVALEEHQTAVAKLQGFEGQEITGKGLSQGRRGSNAGLPRVASQTAAEPEETPEEGEEDLAPGDGPIDLAALEAKRDEARRLRAQAEEADEIFKVYDDMDVADKEIERLLEEIEKAKAEAKAAEAQQGEPEPVPPTSPRRNSHVEQPWRRSSQIEDMDEKVRSFIKAEGRKKKKLLQQRNIKFKMLQKLLQQANAQAAASGGATYVPTAPETTEERAERIQKNLDVVQDRTRRLSQQLEFWDNRIDRRKNAMETEKKNLRKEEQNLEHPRDEEASGLSESSQDTPEADPLDIDLTQESLAGGANDLLSNKKGHVIAKKYSRMMRPTVFRKSKVSATEEEDLKPERMPLALFGGQAGSHTEGAAHDGGRRSSGHLTVEHPKSRRSSTAASRSSSSFSADEEEVDLADGPGAAFDQLVRKLSRRENSSFLEGIQKLRPSARHYTRGTRREGPGQKKRSKRRISIQSFVDKLSDQAPDSRRPSAEEELDLPQQGSRRLTQPPEGPGRSTSRVSNASIESRPFSDRDGGDIQRIVQQAMRKMEESNEAQQVDVVEWLQKALKERRKMGDKMRGKMRDNTTRIGDPGEMHLETVRLLRRAAQMTAKNQVSEDVLSSANFLQAHQMDLLSVQGQQKAVPSQRSVYKVDDSPMVGSNQVLAWADRRPGRAITARARYALTKAQLLALDAMPSAPSRSPSKKEALRRLYRAGTSPLRDTSLRSLKGSRSLSRSRSKLSRQDLSDEGRTFSKPEAARAKRADAHKEIMRLKVMALHHSAQRRRLLQHQQAMSSDEEEEAQAKSIMELAEASQKTSDFRGGGVDRMPSKVTNTKSGQGPIFNEEMPDERVSEVAAKWRGERSDTEPSLMVDAALSEAEVAKPLAHNAFRPFRSRSRARRIARPRPARPPEQESSSSSSSSDEDYHGSSPSRHGDGSERSREENVHFRNVSYFIDLMNENDSRRRRSNKKNSRRRRKALEHQQKQAVRADFRWHSHMLKLMELQLANPRQSAPPPPGPGSISGTGSDGSRAPPRRLAAPRTRGRTPRRREHRELHTEEHQVVPVATSEVHLNLGPEKPSSEVKQEVPLSPKNVKVKLEEGGWTRLPQIAPEVPRKDDWSSLQSPWWGRNAPARTRFAASTARGADSRRNSDMERDREERAQKWAAVGALALGRPARTVR